MKPTTYLVFVAATLVLLEHAASKNVLADIPRLAEQTEVSRFIDCHNFFWKRFCQLPRCSCSGTAIPKSLPIDKVPQMIVLTFQGTVRSEDLVHYQQLLNRTNPNGCQASGTFFVEHENTDYFRVQSLAAQRHEIAINGITSVKRSKAWWKNATEADWENDMLSKYSLQV